MADQRERGQTDYRCVRGETTQIWAYVHLLFLMLGEGGLLRVKDGVGRGEMGREAEQGEGVRRRWREG